MALALAQTEQLTAPDTAAGHESYVNRSWRCVVTSRTHSF